MAGGAKQRPARSISPSIDFRAEAASGSTALWEQGVGTRVLLGDVKVRRGRLQIAVSLFCFAASFLFLHPKPTTTSPLPLQMGNFVDIMELDVVPIGDVKFPSRSFNHVQVKLTQPALLPLFMTRFAVISQELQPLRRSPQRRPISPSYSPECAHCVAWGWGLQILIAHRMSQKLK
jgi:hypothetical protein